MAGRDGDPCRICRRGPLGPLFVCPLIPHIARVTKRCGAAMSSRWSGKGCSGGPALSVVAAARADAGARRRPRRTSSVPRHDGDWLPRLRGLRRCHRKRSTGQRSLHVSMTKPLAEATVVGDSAAQAPITASLVGTAAEDVHAGRFGRAPGASGGLHAGAKRYQGERSKSPTADLVMPAFWHIESGGWLDWKRSRHPRGEHDLGDLEHNCSTATPRKRAGIRRRRQAVQATWTELRHRLRSVPRSGRPQSN